MDWVLTVISKDRPGIIEDMAEVISRHKGNWVKSSMSRLGGEFAGIVQVTLPDEATTSFEGDLTALKQNGLNITMQKDPGSDAQATPEGEIAVIELTGLDHVGIVHDITRMLAANNVTIEDFETVIFTGSMTGEPMFYAVAKILLPEGLTLKALEEIAESIAGDIMVDINLEIMETE